MAITNLGKNFLWDGGVLFTTFESTAAIVPATGLMNAPQAGTVTLPDGRQLSVSGFTNVEGSRCIAIFDTGVVPAP